MKNDTIFLYLIASVSFLFALYNALAFWAKRNMTGKTTGITGYEAAGLVRSLVTKGFLYEPENNNLELTEKGKLEGMDCLARHEKLTQFFQMVSGMDQERAQEDACRVEHYISPEGLKGIEHFLQYGDVYDRGNDGIR